MFIVGIFTARVRSTTGRYCFHRCLSVHRGGGGGPVRYPPRGVWVPPRGGDRSPGTPRGGTEVRVPPQGGTEVRVPPQGGTEVQVPPGGGGTQVRVPPPGGVPDPGRTTEGVLTTQRVVCLLRSRRRTFLFFLFFVSLPKYVPRSTFYK